MKNVDLHIHTNFSDGENTPSQVLELCKKNKLKQIAITDHDTIDGYLEAKEINDKKLRLIPGVEVTGIKTEILGYFFDETNSELLTMLEQHKESKKLYIEKKVEGLKDLNVDIEYEEVKQIAGNEILMNPHIAKILVNRNYAKNTQDAFERYISKVRVRLETPPTQPKNIIKTIINARGVPVLPHPWLFPQHIKEDLEYFVVKLQKHGLLGIESTGYCPEGMSEVQGENIFTKIKRIAKDLNLIETGGSDFHGYNTHPKNRLGEFNIDSRKVDELESVFKN